MRILIALILIFVPEVWAEETTKLERTVSILKDTTANGSTASQKAAEPESINLWKGVEALVLCLGVLFIGVALAKKLKIKGAISGARQIKVIERTVVSSKTSLILAEVNGSKVLLSVGPERVSFLNMTTSEFNPSLETLCEAEGKIPS